MAQQELALWNKFSQFFHFFAKKASELIGAPWAFVSAILIIIFWFVAGPFFHFSNGWQLFINNVTALITFLIVFLIQNTQTRDTRDIHIKLDELIRVNKPARKSIIDLDSLSDDQLEKLEEEYKKLAKNK